MCNQLPVCLLKSWWLHHQIVGPCFSRYSNMFLCRAHKSHPKWPCHYMLTSSDASAFICLQNILTSNLNTIGTETNTCHHSLLPDKTNTSLCHASLLPDRIQKVTNALKENSDDRRLDITCVYSQQLGKSKSSYFDHLWNTPRGCVWTSSQKMTSFCSHRRSKSVVHLSITTGVFLNMGGSKDNVRFYRGQVNSQVSRRAILEQVDQQTAEGGQSQDLYLASDEQVLSSGQDSHLNGSIVADDFQNTQNRDQLNSTYSDSNLPIPRKSVDEMSLPELSKFCVNIVPYVKRSSVLQQLVKLGVDLSKVEKMTKVTELLIRSDFKRDILPFLKFLKLVGLSRQEIGHVFTRNPLLFLESVHDLQVRVGYLLHKQFRLAEVAEMIRQEPLILLMNPALLEEKLAFLQALFSLNEHEVREVVKTGPKLLPHKKELLTDMKFHIKEFIGFDDSEMKRMILKAPAIFMSSKNSVVVTFDYLHNHMQLSHEALMIWPLVLTKRLHLIKSRHMFLLFLDRAQYDPYQPNYVSMKALVTLSDQFFCQQVAKRPLQDYYQFLKTL